MIPESKNSTMQIRTSPQFSSLISFSPHCSFTRWKSVLALLVLALLVDVESMDGDAYIGGADGGGGAGTSGARLWRTDETTIGCIGEGTEQHEAVVGLG